MRLVYGVCSIWSIKHHRKGLYTSLLIGCNLNRHLANVNKQAEVMFDTLISQYTIVEGITERLKAESKMEWIAQINNIRSRVTEIVNNDLILI